MLATLLRDIGGSCDTAKEFSNLEGFKRRVVCNALTPWFYAIGDEELIGDYAFPEGFQDDPVYRLGKRFVVFDHDGVPEIKTCMGARFLTEDGSDGYGRQKNITSALYIGMMEVSLMLITTLAICLALWKKMNYGLQRRFGNSKKF